MTITEETTTVRLRRPLYAVAGAGELAYRRLQRLPEQVEALRDRITPRVRSLRELPGRVEALRAGVPARVNTLVTEARHVYGDLVAHGEKIVTGRAAAAGNGTALATAPVKAVRKAVKKAVRKPAPKAVRKPATKGPKA
jgi:hypothetical protein